MTLMPEAKSIVEQGPVDLDPDTDSDDSDINSVLVAEPGFGHFLMNFPYEEPLEELGLVQPHGLFGPYEESSEGKKGPSQPHTGMLNFPYEEASKGMKAENPSLAITNSLHEDEQRYQILNFVQEKYKIIVLRHRMLVYITKG